MSSNAALIALTASSSSCRRAVCSGGTAAKPSPSSLFRPAAVRTRDYASLFVLARHKRIILTFIVAFAATLVFVGAAQAHVPFTNGPKTASYYQTAMNKAAAWDNVACRYRAPHIRCTGILKTEPKTDVWWRFKLTIHKTAARRGYSVTCVTVWAACRRQELRFAT